MPWPHRRLAAALVVLAGSLPGVECQTLQGPALARGPVLEDARGAPDPDRLDLWIRVTEYSRGLAFVQRPTLELFDEGDGAFEALRAATPVPLEARQAPSLATRPADRIGVDVARARIGALRPVDGDEVRVALAFLLDAQRYPHLVEAARAAPGDVGRALRGLLVASAAATADGGLGPAPETPAADPFAQERIDGGAFGGGDLGALPVLAAQAYLRAHEDREAPFRAPPLSTEQILRPRQGRGADRPVWLAGAVAPPDGCRVADDESVGVWTLVRSLVQRGAAVPGPALGAWSGDRLWRWRCDDERAPWLYVAQLDDEAGARAFAAAVPELLPADLGGAPILQRRGRRVLVSDGLPAAEADAIARRLEAVELRSAEQAIALAPVVRAAAPSP